MNLNIHNLSKTFGSLQVLDHVSASLEQGRIYCLMGASGSGKTTLLRILMGLEQPDSGQIQGLGRISAVFQEDRLCEPFTPIENVMMVTGKAFTKDQVYQELSRLLPAESLTRPVCTLSGGMKRRTAICRALLADYDLLLMDEPFTGLDEDTKHTVIRYLLEKVSGKTVIIATHQEQDIKALGAKLLTIS